MVRPGELEGTVQYDITLTLTTQQIWTKHPRRQTVLSSNCAGILILRDATVHSILYSTVMHSRFGQLNCTVIHVHIYAWSSTPLTH